MSDEHQEYMQEMADNLPCACGKRRRAAPQIPASQLDVHEYHDEFTGLDYCILRQSFCCGVCAQIHKLGKKFCVPNQILHRTSRLASN